MSHSLTEMFEAMKASLVTLLTSEDSAKQELKEKVKVMGQAVVWSLLSENESMSTSAIHEHVETVASIFPLIKMEKQHSPSFSSSSDLRIPSRIDLAQSDSGRDTSSSSATTPGSLNWSVYEATTQMFQLNHIKLVEWNKLPRLKKNFTKQQVQKLTEYFKKRPYVLYEDKYQLVEETGLTEQQIMNWFANTRRNLKKKKNTF